MESFTLILCLGLLLIICNTTFFSNLSQLTTILKTQNLPGVLMKKKSLKFFNIYYAIHTYGQNTVATIKVEKAMSSY